MKIYTFFFNHLKYNYPFVLLRNLNKERKTLSIYFQIEIYCSLNYNVMITKQHILQIPSGMYYFACKICAGVKNVN